MSALAPAEFSPETTYLDTASHGLPSARAVAAVHTVTTRWAAGLETPRGHDPLVPELRESFAHLLDGASADDIAIGPSVASLIGPVAAALPSGAEVLVVEGEFASVPLPFLTRGDLAVRTVALEDLAEQVRPRTALVAVSSVQSADGRTVDLPALRAATLANDARLLVDVTQSAGWLPMRFTDADYWVCASFKWLVGTRSIAFFAAGSHAAGSIRPLAPGWYSANDRAADMYDPKQLAPTARRFDATPDWLGVIAAHAGLALLRELTVERIHAHDLALADRFRAGLATLGLDHVPSPAPIVSVTGTPDDAARLRAAGIVLSAREHRLRFSFHLYNDDTDVDHALDVLGAN
ncbi:aminotransferase class V-fold PLP-dependent enzyme [Nocardia callitridis]|uniref:Aminotransferase class V-fold PLP-dependent enzyme n=1 Tax=Nocardia callitridis TaxID=648753 RepID=A0ABP9K4B9_9NOCA